MMHAQCMITASNMQDTHESFTKRKQEGLLSLNVHLINFASSLPPQIYERGSKLFGACPTFVLKTLAVASVEKQRRGERIFQWVFHNPRREEIVHIY